LPKVPGTVTAHQPKLPTVEEPLAGRSPTS